MLSEEPTSNNPGSRIIPPIVRQKRELRERYLEVRAHVTEMVASQAAQAIMSLFKEKIPLAKGVVIAGYLPLGSEVDIVPLMEWLKVEGYMTALPCITGKAQPLQFQRWVMGDPLVQGRFYRVYEPDCSASMVKPDILIVPLIAFDKQGNRLGFGGGYYDRTLALLRAENPSVMAVGVGFDAQEAEMLPVEGTDQKLDWVVTEKRVLRCS